MLVQNEVAWYHIVTNTVWAMLPMHRLKLIYDPAVCDERMGSSDGDGADSGNDSMPPISQRSKPMIESNSFASHHSQALVTGYTQEQAHMAGDRSSQMLLQCDSPAHVPYH